MTNRKVKVKVAFGAYRVGDIIEPTGAHRQWLITNGYVLPLDEEKPETRLTKRGGPGKGAKKRAA